MPKAIENTCFGITKKQAESSGLDFDSLRKEEEALEPGARKVLEQEALIFERGFNKGRKKDGNYIRSWVNFSFIFALCTIMSIIPCSKRYSLR